VDIVYFNSPSNWGEELRYSLRSVETYYEELDRIFIVGYVPSYISEDSIIHIQDIKNKNGVYIESYARYIFCKLSICQGNFILLCDDQYLLRPLTSSDFVPLTVEVLKPSNRVDTGWRRMLWRTYDVLTEDYNLQLVHNLESHTPIIFNKNKFIDVFSNFRYLGEYGNYLYDGVCTITSYFHLSGTKFDIIPADLVRAGFVSNYTVNYPKVLDSKSMFFHNDKGLTKDLVEYLKSKFPNKSRFEI